MSCYSTMQVPPHVEASCTSNAKGETMHAKYPPRSSSLAPTEILDLATFFLFQPNFRHTLLRPHPTDRHETKHVLQSASNPTFPPLAVYIYRVLVTWRTKPFLVHFWHSMSPLVALGESPNICTHPESSERDEQLARTTLPLLIAQLRAASQRKKDWLHQSAPTQRMDVFLNSATCQRPASIHARTWQGLECNKDLRQCLENACAAI